MFNFKRLIKKYSKNPCYHVTYVDGGYDYENGGDWVDGEETQVMFQGAVLPLSNEDLKFDESGTYTVNDRKVYTYNKMSKGDIIRCNNLDYVIHTSKDYSDFDKGLYIYTIIKEGEIKANEYTRD